jgi:uncharacterized membrane protein/mono/diheme cytochrome c family protein
MTYFIGHLHPLLVHLPIGILLFGILMMLYQQLTAKDLNDAISLAFLVGAISALFACIAGWLLAQSGEYDEALILKHQWTGIATAVISFVIYFLQRFRWVLVSILAILLTITGHFGATITHGEDYIFPATNDTAATQVATNDTTLNFIDTTQFSKKDTFKIVKYNIYQAEILPILKTNCYNCHAASKQKEGLRLDSESFIKKGSKNSLVLIAGDPLNSLLYSSLVLPIEDEKHMPPKGKHQLTPKEIQSIRKWIQYGASFKTKVDTIYLKNGIASQPTIQSDIISKEKKYDNTFKQVPNNQPATAPSSLISVKNPDTVSSTVLNLFQQKKIILTPIASESNWLMANFVNAVPFEKSNLLLLKQIDQQLVTLKLTNLPVKDEDIKVIAGFPNLQKLNLENTAITNLSLEYLQQLPRLQTLNLYGTNITDEGLTKLIQCKSLTAVYVWRTNTTEEGIEKFKKARPSVKIETGDFKFQTK